MKKLLIQGTYTFYSDLKKHFIENYIVSDDIRTLKTSDFLVLQNVKMSEIDVFVNRVRALEHRCKIIVFSSVYNPKVTERLFPELYAFRYTGTEEAYSDILDVINGEEKYKDDFKLTSKEKSYLAELSYGLNSRQIAEVLSISERSVRRLKENLYRKTSAHTEQELLLISHII